MLAIGLLLLLWALVAPLLNASVTGFLLIRHRLKHANERPNDSYVASRLRRFFTVALWSIVIWSLPIAAIGLMLAGNRFEVGHHPLPDGLERVWVNSEIWSIPGGVVLLVSAPLVIVYLNRLLRANVKNAVIYAFSAWVFMRISWLQSFSWLRSSQLEDEWRKAFATGPFTVEVSVAVAVVALIVAMLVAKFGSSRWAPALIACFALPAIVQYWMAGEPITLLDGIFSLALFGYTASKMMQLSMLAQTGSLSQERRLLSDQILSHSRQTAVKFVMAGVLCTVGIALVTVIIGVKPMSIASTVVPLAMAAGMFIATIAAKRITRARFNEAVVATTATIVSLVVASLIVNGSWIPSKITHPDFDGWLLYGSQVVLMATVGCVGLIVTLYIEKLRDLRPFLAGITIPLLGYLIFWEFPAPNFSSWEMGNVLPISAHKWTEISVVLAFMLGAVWFVFGAGADNSEQRVDVDKDLLPLRDV